MRSKGHAWIVVFGVQVDRIVYADAMLSSVHVRYGVDRCVGSGDPPTRKHRRLQRVHPFTGE